MGRGGIKKQTNKPGRPQTRLHLLLSFPAANARGQTMPAPHPPRRSQQDTRPLFPRPLPRPFPRPWLAPAAKSARWKGRSDGRRAGWAHLDLLGLVARPAGPSEAAGGASCGRERRSGKGWTEGGGAGWRAAVEAGARPVRLFRIPRPRRRRRLLGGPPLACALAPAAALQKLPGIPMLATSECHGAAQPAGSVGKAEGARLDTGGRGPPLERARPAGAVQTCRSRLGSAELGLSRCLLASSSPGRAFPRAADPGPDFLNPLFFFPSFGGTN